MEAQGHTSPMTQNRPSPWTSHGHALGWLKPFAVSALGHLVFLAGLAWAADTFTRAPTVKTVLHTRLVRLGKPKPKDQLPEIEVAKAAPKPVAKPAPKPAPTPVAKPKPKPAPKAKPAAKIAKPKPKAVPKPAPKAKPESGVSNALARLRKRSRKDASTAGAADGSTAGTVSDVGKRLIGHRYLSEIHACVQQHYSIDGVARVKSRGLQAEVRLHVNAAGKFTRVAIAQSSGLGAMDRAVLKAVQRCKQVSPPHREIRQSVLKEGVLVVFETTD